MMAECSLRCCTVEEAMKSTTTEKRCCETDRDDAQRSKIRFRRPRRRFLSALPTLPTLLLLLLSTVLLPITMATDQDGFRYVNTTRLAAFADDFRRGWPTARRGEFKMHLRPADPPRSSDDETTVCGYTFTARTDYSVTGSRAARGHVPAPTTFRCDDRDEYRVHVALGGGNDAASSYERVVDLPSDLPSDLPVDSPSDRRTVVELETAGVRALPIASLCFGFLVGGGGGGVRAFCADVALLTACRRSQAKSDANIDFGTNSVRLKAERSYSCRRVVFRDAEALFDGFRRLVRDRDDSAARRAICDRVEFVRADDRVLSGCVGETRTTTPADDDRGDDVTDPVQFEFRGPDGRTLVDVNGAYEKCHVLNADAPQTATASGASGLRALKFARGPRHAVVTTTFLLVLILLS